MVGIEEALAEHTYSHLFIECLGWDRLRAQAIVQHDGLNVELEAVAQKRGLTVFAASTHRTVLANRRALRNIQRQLRKTHHEHILIHYCDTPRKQVWQWATVADDGRRIQHREHPFFSDQPPPRLLERIRGLEIRLDDEEQTDLIEVLARVRQVLLPDSEFSLFAERPGYAARSDPLAMAVKRGEPGALGAFVEFHMKLARKSSRMLIRWFGMDADDAEQTAMIGLLEAARRFDPERGYQFSTYASYWIRQCCQRDGLEWGMSIRMPTYIFWPCYRLAFVETRLIATYGRQEARERFLEELDKAEITREQWECFCTARQMACFSDVDAPRHALLGQRDATVDMHHDAMSQEVCGEVPHCEYFDDTRGAILKMRYGIGQREHTLQEIADILKITRERVRQIQAKAEQRLQRYLLQSKLRRDGLFPEARIAPTAISEDGQPTQPVDDLSVSQLLSGPISDTPQSLTIG